VKSTATVTIAAATLAALLVMIATSGWAVAVRLNRRGRRLWAAAGGGDQMARDLDLFDFSARGVHVFLGEPAGPENEFEPSRSVPASCRTGFETSAVRVSVKHHLPRLSTERETRQSPSLVVKPSSGAGERYRPYRISVRHKQGDRLPAKFPGHFQPLPGSPRVAFRRRLRPTVRQHRRALSR